MDALVVSPLMLALCTLCTPGALAFFPEYHDPVTAEPPLQRVGTLRHRAPLISGAALSSYGQLAQQPYTPPPLDPAAYDQVVLEWEGAVKGVQFDRYGALWLGEVELLRTTTPEPSPDGIEWRIERDVTEYAAHFGRASAGANATLSIPNVVDATYTGVLHVNASLAFYSAPAPAAAAAPAPPLVVPLANAVAGGAPWAALSLAGNATQVHALQLPAGTRNARRLFLDVFASGHGCEEFWYTNLPDGLAPQYGACGGGAFRLLELRVDGTLAGARFPFPVVYTGGINPLLWRPLTGIESFDVVPYRFDLTAFAGQLNDGAAHNVSLRMLGNNEQGVWYVDPVLLVYTDAGHGALPGPAAQVRVQAALDVRVRAAARNGSAASPFELDVRTGTARPFRFTVAGGAAPYAASTSYELQSTNRNQVGAGGDQQVSAGSMLETIRSTAAGGGGDGGGGGGGGAGGAEEVVRASVSNFTYGVDQSSRSDNSSFDLQARVSPIRRARQETLGAFSIAWANEVAARARYNRSTGAARVINVQEGSSTESFTIATGAGAGACYNLTLRAVNGTLLGPAGPAGGRAGAFACDLPAGVRFCGQELCGYGVVGMAGSGGRGHAQARPPQNEQPTPALMAGTQRWEDSREGKNIVSKLRANDATLQQLWLQNWLQNTSVGDSGAIALAEALKTNTTLQQLCLNNTSVGDGGAIALGEALKTNTTLQGLSLSYTSVGDGGATALGEALKTNTTLQKLGLNHTSVGDGGAIALAEALKTNTTLQKLWLYNTSVGDGGATALAEALKTNTTLLWLGLDPEQQCVMEQFKRELKLELADTKRELERTKAELAQHLPEVVDLAGGADGGESGGGSSAGSGAQHGKRAAEQGAVSPGAGGGGSQHKRARVAGHAPSALAQLHAQAERTVQVKRERDDAVEEGHEEKQYRDLFIDKQQTKIERLEEL
eukprot:g4366.t1